MSTSLTIFPFPSLPSLPLLPKLPPHQHPSTKLGFHLQGSFAVKLFNFKITTDPWKVSNNYKICKKLQIHYRKISRKIHLLLLSHFGRVWLCATPWTAARQAPPSLGFSRQERWGGLPFPSPKHESESEVAQSCLTLRDPMDCSLPGSSVHGIFQARVLERGAIAFS